MQKHLGEFSFQSRDSLRDSLIYYNRKNNDNQHRELNGFIYGEFKWKEILFLRTFYGGM